MQSAAEPLDGVVAGDWRRLRVQLRQFCLVAGYLSFSESPVEHHLATIDDLEDAQAERCVALQARPICASSERRMSRTWAIPSFTAWTSWKRLPRKKEASVSSWTRSGAKSTKRTPHVGCLPLVRCMRLEVRSSRFKVHASTLMQIALSASHRS